MLAAWSSCSRIRHDAAYYREQAERAQRLARGMLRDDIVEPLSRMAQDYADTADELETGAIEIRHPEFASAAASPSLDFGALTLATPVFVLLQHAFSGVGDVPPCLGG